MAVPVALGAQVPIVASRVLHMPDMSEAGSSFVIEPVKIGSEMIWWSSCGRRLATGMGLVAEGESWQQVAIVCRQSAN